MQSFAEVTALATTAPGRFDAAIHPDWTIAGKPNGGYLLAMLARAATTTAAHQHVLAASAHYLRAPEPGAIVLSAEVLREGRSAGQLRARILQHDRCCVEALFTVGTLDATDEPYWAGGAPDVGVAAHDDCVRLPPLSPTGLPVPIMEQVDLRIDPDCLGFAHGHPSGRGELRGWLGLLGDEPFDTHSLLYAVDAFPPATFEIEPTGWVPTLELTCYVRALPARGPVRVLHRAQLVEGGRVDEVCTVWDVRGRLVAQGTQLAAIRLG